MFHVMMYQDRIESFPSFSKAMKWLIQKANEYTSGNVEWFPANGKALVEVRITVINFTIIEELPKKAPLETTMLLEELAAKLDWPVERLRKHLGLEKEKAQVEMEPCPKCKVPEKYTVLWQLAMYLAAFCNATGEVEKDESIVGGA